jgi:hypothetical protein
MANVYGEGYSRNLRAGLNLGGGGAFEGALEGIALGERFVDQRQLREQRRHQMLQEKQRLGLEHERLRIEQEKQDLLRSAVMSGAIQPDALQGQIAGGGSGGGGGGGAPSQGGARRSSGGSSSGGDPIGDGWVDNRVGLEKGQVDDRELGDLTSALDSIYNATKDNEDLRVNRRTDDARAMALGMDADYELAERIANANPEKQLLNREEDFSDDELRWRDAVQEDVVIPEYERASAGQGGYGIAGDGTRVSAQPMSELDMAAERMGWSEGNDGRTPSYQRTDMGVPPDEGTLSDDALADAAVLLEQREQGRQSELAAALAEEGGGPLTPEELQAKREARIETERTMPGYGGRARSADHDKIMEDIAVGREVDGSTLEEALAAGHAEAPGFTEPQTGIQNAIGLANTIAAKAGRSARWVPSPEEINLIVNNPEIRKLYGISQQDAQGLLAESADYRNELSSLIGGSEKAVDRSDKRNAIRARIEAVYVDPKTKKPLMSPEAMDALADSSANSPDKFVDDMFAGLEKTVTTLELALPNVQVRINPNEPASIVQRALQSTVNLIRTKTEQIGDVTQKLNEATDPETKAALQAQITAWTKQVSDLNDLALDQNNEMNRLLPGRHQYSAPTVDPPPAVDIDAEVEAARAAGASEDQVAALIEALGGDPSKVSAPTSPKSTAPIKTGGRDIPLPGEPERVVVPPRAEDPTVKMSESDRQLYEVAHPEEKAAREWTDYKRDRDARRAVQARRTEDAYEKGSRDSQRARYLHKRALGDAQDIATDSSKTYDQRYKEVLDLWAEYSEVHGEGTPGTGGGIMGGRGRKNVTGFRDLLTHLSARSNPEGGGRSTDATPAPAAASAATSSAPAAPKYAPEGSVISSEGAKDREERIGDIRIVSNTGGYASVEAREDAEREMMQLAGEFRSAAANAGPRESREFLRLADEADAVRAAVGASPSDYGKGKLTGSQIDSFIREIRRTIDSDNHTLALSQISELREVGRRQGLPLISEMVRELEAEYTERDRASRGR